MAHLLVLSGELHEQRVVSERFDSLLNHLLLLNTWVGNDIRIDWLDVVENWIDLTSGPTGSTLTEVSG